MIDLEKILNNLDQEIKKCETRLRWAKSPGTIVVTNERLYFLQNLRSALTIPGEPKKQ